MSNISEGVEHMGRKICAVVVVVLALAAVAAHRWARPQIASARPPYAFSGEDLFRGLFFGQGPVAAHFPEVANAIPRVSADLVERVTNRLRQQDPRFFDRLAAGLQSGDHLVIAATMDRAARMLETVLEEEGRVRPRLVGSMELELAGAEGGGYGPGAGAGAGADEGRTLQFVRDIYIFIDTVHIFTSSRGASKLQRELWVNLLAQRLPQTEVDASLPFPVARTGQRSDVDLLRGQHETIFLPHPPILDFHSDTDWQSVFIPALGMGL